MFTKTMIALSTALVLAAQSVQRQLRQGRTPNVSRWRHKEGGWYETSTAIRAR